MDSFCVFASSPEQKPLVTPLLDTSSLALGGPLPGASVLHVALSILKIQLLESFEGSPSIEKPLVLIISPDKRGLLEDLVGQPDQYLAEAMGTPRKLQMMDHIVIRYCPSAAHFAMLMLSMETSSSNASHPANLPRYPTAIIAHGLSSYFKEDALASCSSYSSMLSQIMDVVRHIDERRHGSSASSLAPCKAVLLDTGLFSNSLPVMPASLRKGKTTKQDASSPERTKQSDSMGKLSDEIQLAKLAEYFFDVIGQCHDLDASDKPLATADDGEEPDDWLPRHFRLSYVASPRRPTCTQEPVEINFTISKVALDSGTSDRLLQRVTVDSVV